MKKRTTLPSEEIEKELKELMKSITKLKKHFERYKKKKEINKSLT